MQSAALNIVDIPVSRLCNSCKSEKNISDFYQRKNKPSANYQYKIRGL